MQKERVPFFDVMKAMAIMSVIINHIILWGMNGFDQIRNSFWLITIDTQMPMFFFISGYMFYRSDLLEHPLRFVQSLQSKFCPFILSACLFLFVYNYMMGGNLSEAFSSTYKSGYWFTPLLFMFYAIQYLLLTIARGKSWVLVLLSVTFYIALEYFLQLLSPQIIGYLSLDQWYYLLFFVFGYLAHKYRASFEGLQDNRYYQLLSVVVFFLLNILHILGFSVLSGLVFSQLILPMVNCTVLYQVFYQMRDIFKRDNFLNKSLTYIGTSTLEIYFLQFFFIPRNLVPLCTKLGLYNTPILMITLAIFLSVIPLMLSLVTGRILRSSSFLSYLLFAKRR